MATNLLFKANPLLLSVKSKTFHRNLYCMKSVQFTARSEFAPFKSKSLMNSTSISSSKSNVEVSSTFKDLPSENHVINTVLNWLRIRLVVLVLFSLIMHRHKSALAFSGGRMGGHSFSHSKSHSHSNNRNRDWGVKYKPTHRITQDQEDDGLTAVIAIAFFVFAVIVGVIDHNETTTTIIKLQMAVLVNGQSLRKDLNRIAKTTDTSTSDGWRRILNGTIKSLLQHFENVRSYDLIYEWRDTSEEAEKCFKQFSNEERAKFKEETLVNLNNMKKEEISTQIANQSMNTYIVVTILIAIKGPLYMPLIIHRDDLKKLLKKLQSTHSSQEIKGVNVLWAPQQENEIMSLREVRQIYPRLESFYHKIRFFWQK